MIQRSLRRCHPAWRQSHFLSARSDGVPFAAARSVVRTASSSSHASRALPFLATRSASSPLTIRRRNSTQSQATEATKQDVPDSQAEAPGEREAKPEPAEQTDGTQAELEAAKKEVIELTDRLKRSMADYRNLQEQTRREIRASRDFALQGFAKDLLESIDNLDRALTTVPAEKLTETNKELVDLHGGLKMTEQILMSTLGKHGLERFDPSENKEQFDPNRMEATFQAPQPGKEDGTVFHTQQKGFVLNGRVLRAAKVGVVKNA